MNKITLGYATRLLNLILIGTTFFSFTPYLGKDIITLFDTPRFFIISYMLLSAIALIIYPSLRNYIIKEALKFSKPIRWILIITLLFAFIANMTGLYWFKSQSVFIYLIMLLLMTFLLKSVVLNRQDFINKSYILLSLALFSSVFLGFLFDAYFGKFNNLFSIYSFTNPRFLNHIQAWLMMPLFYLAIKNKDHKYSGLFYIPTSLNFAIMYALDGRGIILTTLSGLALLILMTPSLRFELVKKLTVSLILGYVIKFSLIDPLPLYLMHDIWSSTFWTMRTGSSGRIELWGVAVQMISFFGHGGDTFVCNNDFNAAAEHNSLLGFSIDWGIIPALGYVSLIMIAFYRICKSTSVQTKVLGITMLSGFGYSLISNVVNTPLSQGLMIITIALFWASLDLDKGDKGLKEPTQLSNPLRIALHGLLILAAVWALVFIGLKAYDRIDNNQYRDLEVDKYKPQFWAGHNCEDAEPKLEVVQPK